MKENYIKIDGSKIKAVIFDMDGTLYNNKYIIALATIRFIFQAKLLKAFSETRKEMKGYQSKSEDDFKKVYFERMSQKSQCSLSAAEKFYNDFLKYFLIVLKTAYKAYPDVKLLISALDKKGIKLACLSDYKMVPERMDALGIDKSKFLVTKGCEEFGALKPSTLPFFETAKLLELDPSEIAFIGDRDDTDGVGSRQSGMKYIKFREEFKKIEDAVYHG